MNALSEKSAAVLGMTGLQNDPVRGIIWLDVISILLPTLFDMPCFSERTPTEQRKHIEKHPNMSRALAARRARQINRNITKAESFVIADATIEQFLSASESEVVEFRGALVAEDAG